ncbi:MAG: 50S ribosomal protein L6 [Calditrichia bacterium]
MSRIGYAPIVIPEKVEVKIDKQTVTVKGPKGELQETLNPAITIKQEDGQLVFERPNDDREMKSLHGLCRALINNMIVGVTEGFKKTLKIEGVGFRAEKKGNNVVLQLGFSHNIIFKIPKEVTVDVPNPLTIEVSGINKYLVGQVAAKIRSFRKPEPYKGKGIRYENEVVRRKAGKAGA